MFQWIADNAVTIVAIAVILTAVGIAVFSIIRDKKRKKSCCTGNCAACCTGCSYEKNKK